MLLFFLVGLWGGQKDKEGSQARSHGKKLDGKTGEGNQFGIQGGKEVGEGSKSHI